MSSNTNAWGSRNTEGKTDFSFSGGKYFFDHQQTVKGWQTIIPIEIDQFKDFEIEVLLNKVSGVQDYGYGLVWGAQNVNNKFAFLISGDGHWKVLKLTDGDKENIVEWTKSSYINKGDYSTNKLTVRKRSSTLYFYVNESFVKEIPYQAFYGGKVGFHIYNQIKIAIDWLSVSYINSSSSSYSAPPVTSSYNSAPEIRITEPDISRGFWSVQEKLVRVVGQAIDTDGIYEVTANGVEANLNSGGYFSVDVPLAMGENTITIEARDTKFKSSNRTFRVTREGQAVAVNNNNYATRNEKRVALVIGNSNYSGQASLGVNPINDATDMASTLRSIGFEVILRTDADLNSMNNAVREFGRQNRDADVALFYFAGHGMQIERTNYLLPIGVNIKDKHDVGFESVSVSTVQGIMENSNDDRLNLIVLDACRNNPFRSWMRGGDAGLADMTPPSGTLIAFSTSPGSVASNGTGRNGLYTGELIRQMKIPQRIEDVFINTRVEVEKKSGGNQSPWELARLRGTYRLK